MTVETTKFNITHQIGIGTCMLSSKVNSKTLKPCYDLVWCIAVFKKRQFVGGIGVPLHYYHDNINQNYTINKLHGFALGLVLINNNDVPSFAKICNIK